MCVRINLKQFIGIIGVICYSLYMYLYSRLIQHSHIVYEIKVILKSLASLAITNINNNII